MKIQTLSKDKPLVKLLVYGAPGCGKTVFAAGAMDHESLQEVLFLNCEGGLLSVAHKDPRFVNLGKNDDGTSNGQALKDLEDVVFAIVNKTKGYEKFSTVVLDSVSELQVQDIQEIVAAGHATGKRKGDLDDTHQSDYGKDTARMRRILRMLRDAPVNVIITALSTEITSGGENPVTLSIEPQLTKKLSSSLRGYMDAVWFMYMKDGKRYIQTRETDKGIIKAKTRGIAFAKNIGIQVENPTLPVLYTQLVDSLKEAV